MALPNWKGRPYRPVGGTGYIRVYKPDVNELLKPLSEKAGLGSAILTGNIINPVNRPQTTPPVVTPSSTPLVPSVTPTNTPSVTPSSTPTYTPTQTSTITPTPSITPSSTPDTSYRFTSIYYYPEDDTTNISGLTCCVYVNGISGKTQTLVTPPGNWMFSGVGLTNTTTAQTANFIFSATPQSGYYLTGYPPNGRAAYDEQRLTGFTYYQKIGNSIFWSGTTEFYSGGTLVGTEAGSIIELNTVQKRYNWSNPIVPYYDTGYFYVMPLPSPSPTPSMTPTNTPTPSPTPAINYFLQTENTDDIQTEGSDNIEIEY